MLNDVCIYSIFCVEYKNGTQALHMACSGGHLNAVQLLVEEYECNIMCRNYKQQTPLHYAAKNDQLAVIKYLVNANKSVCESRDINGRQPLHIASI